MIKGEKMKKYKIGYTTGVFDMFHVGHLNILRRAKDQCEYLIVGVTTDELCFSRKNKMPIINENDRKAIIESIKYVDRVIFQSDMDKIKPVIENNVDAVFVGSDWQGTPQWNEYEKKFNEHNCDVVYLKYTDNISSTILREKINKHE